MVPVTEHVLAVIVLGLVHFCHLYILWNQNQIVFINIGQGMMSQKKLPSLKRDNVGCLTGWVFCLLRLFFFSSTAASISFGLLYSFSHCV